MNENPTNFVFKPIDLVSFILIKPYISNYLYRILVGFIFD